MKLFVAAAYTSLAMFALAPTSNGNARSAPPQRIEVVARRFEFAPSDITVKKGVPVTLSLTSKDVDHGLKFKDLNVALSVKKGETKEITFTPDKPGTFVGQCSVFCGSGHGGMKMTLHVTE